MNTIFAWSLTITQQTIRVFEPIAIAMMFASLLAFQGFFGGEPGGPVGQGLFNYRWELTLTALAGCVLYVASRRIEANNHE